MRRALAIGLAGVLFLAAVVAVTALVRGGSDDGERVRAPQNGRSPSSERAPEAESTGDQDLPSVERSARAFLSGYLPLIYGRDGATPAQLRDASPSLVAELERDPGRVPPGQAALTPRVVRVAVVREGTGRALASVQIDDQSATAYVLNLRLEDTLSGWLVTRIGP